eukprot:396657_1
MSQDPTKITEQAYLAYIKEHERSPNATQLTKWAKVNQFAGVTYKTSRDVLKNPPSTKETKEEETIPQPTDNNTIINIEDVDEKSIPRSRFPTQNENVCQKHNKQMKQSSKKGLLFFQRKIITKAQMEHIKTSNLDTKPKFVFSDNDIDNVRNSNTTRKYNHGQISEYDVLFGYGIVTTFYNQTRPGFIQFKQLMDAQFEWLQQHLLNGFDVIFTRPTHTEMHSNKKHKYFKNGQQIIHHNIGTEIENFPQHYLQYIQLKINNLKSYSRTTADYDYYNYKPPKTYNNRGRGRGRGAGRGRGGGRMNKPVNQNYNQHNKHNKYTNLGVNNEVMKLKLKVKELEMKNQHNFEMAKLQKE